MFSSNSASSPTLLSLSDFESIISWSRSLTPAVSGTVVDGMTSFSSSSFTFTSENSNVISASAPSANAKCSKFAKTVLTSPASMVMISDFPGGPFTSAIIPRYMTLSVSGKGFDLIFRESGVSRVSIEMGSLPAFSSVNWNEIGVLFVVLWYLVPWCSWNRAGLTTMVSPVYWTSMETSDKLPKTTWMNKSARKSIVFIK